MKTFKQFIEAEEEKIYAKIIKDAPPFSPALAEKDYRIGDVTFSAENGLGSVPFNQSVWYHGLVGMMKPSTFLKLAHEGGTTPKRIFGIVKLMWEGYALGPPFLDIKLTPVNNDEDSPLIAKVVGHEGRHRMKAIMEVEGDVPVPVHLFLKDGLRNRDLTARMYETLKQGLHGQEKNYVVNPFTELWTTQARSQK